AHVTPDTFYDQVLESDFPAYMEFGTEMCYGCQMMKEDLAKLAPEFEGTLFIGEFDVDSDGGEIAGRYINTMTLPGTVCFYKGQKLYSDYGYAGDIDDLRDDLLYCASMAEE
ncbi:MAG: thioredoxin domain-containing protein, partial [Candidatus Woesearchaeota archaeon]